MPAWMTVMSALLVTVDAAGVEVFLETFSSENMPVRSSTFNGVGELVCGGTALVLVGATDGSGMQASTS